MSMETEPLFFPSTAEFRRWLEQHHDHATEIFVGYFKTGSGKKSITWSESVDEALCFGWIDGVRNSIDHESYRIRFTPRKPSSTWSNINIREVEELIRTGRMNQAGLAAYNMRKEHLTGTYAYENDTYALPENLGQKFRENQKAWDYFMASPPSYRKTALKWVMSAKQETTIVKRFQELVRDCESGRKIKQLSYGRSAAASKQEARP